MKKRKRFYCSNVPIPDFLMATGPCLHDALMRANLLHKNEKGERIYFFFVCHEWEGVPVNAEPEKCDQVEWFRLDDLPKNMIPHVRFALEKMVSSKS
jgi:hypothetical protein